MLTIASGAIAGAIALEVTGNSLSDSNKPYWAGWAIGLFGASIAFAMVGKSLAYLRAHRSLQQLHNEASKQLVGCVDRYSQWLDRSPLNRYLMFINVLVMVSFLGGVLLLTVFAVLSVSSNNILPRVDPSVGIKEAIHERQAAAPPLDASAPGTQRAATTPSACEAPTEEIK